MDGNQNRIDPTPVRLSTNLSVDRQTPKTGFGDRLKAGMDTAASTVADGVAIAAPYVPGGAILSAAVSSVTTLANNGASGQQTVSAQYASTAMGMGYTSAGGTLNTGATGNGYSAGMVNGAIPVMNGAIPVTGGTGQITGVPTAGIPTTTTGVPNIPGGVTATGNMAVMNQSLQQQVTDNASLMQIQIAMQRENQVFSTVSNVLKTRHDTVRNTIQNVR